MSSPHHHVFRSVYGGFFGSNSYQMKAVADAGDNDFPILLEADKPIASVYKDIAGRVEQELNI